MDIEQQLRQITTPDRDPMDASSEGRLRDLAAIQRALTALTRSEVEDARSFGLSWADIAAQLGVTRQAAHERYRAANSH